MDDYNKTVEQILTNDLTAAFDILKDFESNKHRLNEIWFNYRDPNDGEHYGQMVLNRCNTDPYGIIICRMVKYHKNFRIHRIRGVYGAWNAYYIDVIREKGKWDYVPQEVVQSFRMLEKQSED